MTPDELKALMDEWQQAMRRYSYLQALREAMPPGPAAHAMNKQIGAAKAEMERLQNAILDSGPAL